MKKFLKTIIILLTMIVIIDYIYFYDGNIYIPYNDEIKCISWIENNQFAIKNKDNKVERFNIKGVDLGLGLPGHFATERAITKETYLRWFKYIKEMGANTIRVYTLQGDDFYEAILEYNKNHLDNPIYIIHGVWLDDKIHIAKVDAFNKKFEKNIKNNALDTVDVIHGRLKKNSIEDSGKQRYVYDISKWVIGYIVGVEWEPQAVEYTNRMKKGMKQYRGEYTYTKDAKPFEIFLARLVDDMIEYESKKYGEQRNFAISNWPTTDPLKYNKKVEFMSKKNTIINVENIKTTNKFNSNQFASYHIYPYYPEYEYYENEDDKANLYFNYIKRLNEYHKIPVIISEFGVPSSRGRGSYEQNRDYARDQGRITEDAQGEAIVSLYKDIMVAGSAGGIVFIWQDEWFKKTWNTEANVDLANTAYWSDVQTTEQSFGLLAFDPGKEKSVCYIDGDKSEWNESDKIISNDKYNISSKYDEKYVYFMVDLKGRRPKNEKICIPIDTIQTIGAKDIRGFNIKSDRGIDFIISIDGENNSKVLVQDRYDAFIMTLIKYNNQFKYYLNNYPEKESKNFVNTRLLLHEFDYKKENKKISIKEFYDERKKEDNVYTKQSKEDYTGNLTYGNGNPNSKDFNSISDFCYGEDFIEIRIPWQMLNFYNPSKMEIHDDYYENYGVEPIKINKMYIGVGTPNSKIEMAPMKLKGWGKKVTYHERLKKSYYILKDYWRKEGV